MGTVYEIKYSISFLKPMFGSSAEAMQDLFPSCTWASVERHDLPAAVLAAPSWAHLGIDMHAVHAHCRSIDSSLLTDLLTAGLQGPETI